ncbi:MAG: hypothetical protein CMP49_04400 [Flavobacteriales bacterium]|nr:hypothetical protein [Flavobacteriales bacterium]
MFTTKSKKFGFFGTVFFHIGLLIIAFFSSIGYTSVEIPQGVEIEFVPYSNENVFDNKNEAINELQLNELKMSNETSTEKVVVDESSTINMNNNEDTITFAENIAPEPSLEISSELKNALLVINENHLKDSVKQSDLSDPSNALNNDQVEADYGQDGYSLSEFRDPVRKIKPKYSCDETGTIIVRVIVNRQGITIQADAGIRGSTESAPCLLKEATEAALKTTWTPLEDAPEKQAGYITYNFQKY